jgi:hypothetical protein
MLSLKDNAFFVPSVFAWMGEWKLHLEDVTTGSEGELVLRCQLFFELSIVFSL